MSSVREVILQLTTGRLAWWPVSLAAIVIDADFLLRYTPSKAELDEALDALVQAGLVGELQDAQFVDGRSVQGRHEHVPVAESVYSQAVFGPFSNEARPSQPAVSITVPTAGMPTIEDWQAVERLAEQLIRALQLEGRAVTVMSISESPAALSFTILAGVNESPQRIRDSAERLIVGQAGLGATVQVEGPKLP